MTLRSTLLCLAVAMPFGASAALAESSDAEPEKLAKYERTGETETCLGLSRIRNTDVLDDQHILFFMRGGDVYLSKLPYKCSRLGFEESFTYSTSLTKLCDKDIITVLDTGGGPSIGPSCGLGTFEKLVEKTEDPAS